MLVAYMSRRELDILNILSESDKALTAAEIVERMSGLTQSTVTTVMRKLMASEFTEVADVVYSGKMLSRAYRVAPKARKYLIEQFTANYAGFQKAISRSQMCAAILQIEDNDLEGTRQDVSKLRKILKDMEKEL